MSDTESVTSPSARENGDWTCVDCGNVNFARRNSCNRCTKEKSQCQSSKKKKLGHEIGKAAAEKSRGLFSADDWQCNKCGNVNWARRQQCNVCNAPKFGEVEERTGFGGGYNDRGVVEYKERADSDDEYDEFGRRKKRMTTTTTRKEGGGEREEEKRVEEVKPSATVAATVPVKAVAAAAVAAAEEDEEEDEDDDEDGDLSKYDLTDWGDDAGESNKGTDRKSRSGSRSRSRSPVRKH